MKTAASTLPAPAPPANLSPIEWQALRIAAKPADETRDALTPRLGVEVDFLLHIGGVVNVLPNQVFQVKGAPTAFDLVAILLLQLSPKSRRRVLDGAIAAAKDPEPTQFPPEIIEQTQDLIGRLTVKVPQERRGSVTGPITAERIASARAYKG